MMLTKQKAANMRWIPLQQQQQQQQPKQQQLPRLRRQPCIDLQCVMMIIITILVLVETTSSSNSAVVAFTSRRSSRSSSLRHQRAATLADITRQCMPKIAARAPHSLFALMKLDNDGMDSSSLLSTSSSLPSSTTTTSSLPSFSNRPPSSIWETMAQQFVHVDRLDSNPSELQHYVQYVTLFRVGLPSLALAGLAQVLYPTVAMFLAHTVIQDDAGVFAVVAQDASQYIQNILTTSGLIFSLLVGQTYYFMYQQQEAIYLALFNEVTVAKSLLEQVALVCQGRDQLYHRILRCIDHYVQYDLTQFQIEPAVLLSRRPVDDPLEDILYLTSVGEPSVIYSTVRALRQARAERLGALQRKLPNIHMILLWSLAFIVLFTFPLLGAAVQTIGGMGILKVQAWYLSFIVFGICMTLGVINELRQPEGRGAYNVVTVLAVMVQGLDQELKMRLESDGASSFKQGPTVDPDHPAFYFARDAEEVEVLDETDNPGSGAVFFHDGGVGGGGGGGSTKTLLRLPLIGEDAVVSQKQPFWRFMFRRRWQRK